MTRYTRVIKDNAFYHIVNRGVEKRKIFLDEEDYKSFMQLLSLGCKKFGVHIVAFCLMPNHFHLLVLTSDGTVVSDWAKWIQGIYAQSFNRRHCRTGHLWQDRFFAKEVGKGLHLAKTWMYVEQNPVKAKLVDAPPEWYWSSAYLRSKHLSAEFLIEPDWWRTEQKSMWWSEKLLDSHTLEKVRKSLKRNTIEQPELVWIE